MGTIKDFNAILNRSDPNRFEHWKTYRRALTDYIIANSKRKVSKLLVIAAGNSDDLDLVKLAAKTDLISLSDVDPTALNYATKKYSLNPDQTDMLTFEYTGLSKSELWDRLVKAILKTENEQEIDELIGNLEKTILRYEFPEKYHGEFDEIIVSPVYTQLLFQQLTTSVSIINDLNYDQNLSKYIYQKFLDLMPKILDKFNQNIVNLLSENGEIFVISDIFEGEDESKFVNAVRKLLGDDKKMEEYYQKYQKKYGPGMGDFGLMNLSEKLRMEISTWMEWPFSNERIIYVKVAKYTR